ncbi:MAG: thioredoxin family protein [Verrucomicrobiota bacterium]
MKKNSSEPSDEKSQRSSSKKLIFWRWFWLGFLAISLGYAWHSFYVPPYEMDWVEDVTAANDLATKSDKNVMLFFTAKWCAPCRIMKREVFADDEVQSLIRAEIVPVMIYTDSPGGEDLIDQYRIGTTPVTIFTDGQGNVLDYAVGGVSKPDFLALLGRVAAR